MPIDTARFWEQVRLGPVEFDIHRVPVSMGGGVLLVEIPASETVWFREMVGSSCVFDYQYK